MENATPFIQITSSFILISHILKLLKMNSRLISLSVFKEIKGKGLTATGIVSIHDIWQLFILTIFCSVSNQIGHPNKN